MPRPGLSPEPVALVASLTGHYLTRQGQPPIRLVLDQAQSFDVQLRTDMIYQFSVRVRGAACMTWTYTCCMLLCQVLIHHQRGCRIRGFGSNEGLVHNIFYTWCHVQGFFLTVYVGAQAYNDGSAVDWGAPTPAPAATTNLCDSELLVHADTYERLDGYITNDLAERRRQAGMAGDGATAAPALPTLPTGDPSTWLTAYDTYTACKWIFRTPPGSITSFRIRCVEF